MSVSDIEKQNLEAHVEMSIQRHHLVAERLDEFNSRMDHFEEMLVEIQNSINSANDARQKQVITVISAIIGVLITALITTILHFVK